MQHKPVKPADRVVKFNRDQEARPITHVIRQTEMCAAGNQRVPASPLDVFFDAYMEDPERWDGMS